MCAHTQIIYALQLISILKQMDPIVPVSSHRTHACKCIPQCHTSHYVFQGSALEVYTFMGAFNNLTFHIKFKSPLQPLFHTILARVVQML